MVKPPEAESAFGATLRSLRLAAGMSLSELSRRTHYSKGYLSRLENGAKTPSVEFARVSDAVLAADGRLVRLLTEASTPAGEAPEPTPPAPAPPAGELSVSAGHSLHVFRDLLENLRDLGQTMGPTAVLPMLLPHTEALAALADRVASSEKREVLLLAARFAEYSGWMSQELGDDLGALRWTDESARLAAEAGDEDMVAYAYVRRANIALYQHDAYGVVSNARRVQGMRCGARVKGLAALREAQGHALASDYAEFERCIEDGARYLGMSEQDAPDRPVLGAVRIPSSVALSTGWGLYDLGRNREAVEVLSPLFERTPQANGRAWARIGARLALALIGDGQVDRACEILHPVLVMLPAIESATIRSDIRQLARILARRWSGHPPVRDLMRELSAALTPPGAHAIVRPEARRS